MQTIDQALSILRFFSEDHYEISLTNLSHYSGFDKAKTRRYLMALLKHGFVEQNTRTRAYRLGVGALRLARVHEKVIPLETVSRPAIRRLRDLTRQTTFLSMLTGEKMSVLELEESKRGRRPNISEGDLLPLHATAEGLVVLAYSRMEFQDKYLAQPLEKFTKYTVTEKARLRALFRLVAADGFMHASRTYEDGIDSIASPIFNSEGMPSGAVSVAMPYSAGKKTQIKGHCRRVLQMAVEITKKIGGTPHDIQKEFVRNKTRARR